MTGRRLLAATRSSPLARWQTDHVVERLRDAHPTLDAAPVTFTAAPDTNLSQPLWQIGGKGAFAKEVQQAVLDGRADLAVHSAKDLPSRTVPGLVLAAVLERGDARDALVGCSLADLAPGACIATGSARRRAQLADWRPDLTFAQLRGNIQRRVAAAGRDGVTAVVVGGVALERQGLARHITEWLEPELMCPQVGQGAIAVECRGDDDATIDLLAAIDHHPTRRCLVAERSYLAALGGDCDLPAGAHATLPDGTAGPVRLRAVLATLDATRVIRQSRVGDDEATLGAEVAATLPVQAMSTV